MNKGGASTVETDNTAKFHTERVFTGSHASPHTHTSNYIHSFKLYIMKTSLAHITHNPEISCMTQKQTNHPRYQQHVKFYVLTDTPSTPSEKQIYLSQLDYEQMYILHTIWSLVRPQLVHIFCYDIITQERQDCCYHRLIDNVTS